MEMKGWSDQHLSSLYLPIEQSKPIFLFLVAAPSLIRLQRFLPTCFFFRPKLLSFEDDRPFAKPFPFANGKMKANLLFKSGLKSSQNVKNVNLDVFRCFADSFQNLKRLDYVTSKESIFSICCFFRQISARFCSGFLYFWLMFYFINDTIEILTIPNSYTYAKSRLSWSWQCLLINPHSWQ